MKVSELKSMIPDHETILLADSNYETIDINENAYLTKEYDDFEIVQMYGERYSWIPAVGITVIVKESKYRMTVRDVIKTLEGDQKVCVVDSCGDIISENCAPFIYGDVLEYTVDIVSSKVRKIGKCYVGYIEIKIKEAIE